MKYLFLFIFLSSFCAQAQNVTIKEIRLKPDSAFYSPNNATIVYPVIVTTNSKIDALINKEIRDRILYADNDKIDTRRALSDQTKEGLINMSYEVTFKKYGILSINIYAEGCGAHCSSWTTYFNFDLRTGAILTIKDLISATKIDSFERMVFNDKLKALTDYKTEELNLIKNNEIDSADYDWAMALVDENCISTVQIETFSLSDQGIEIIDPCEFPHAIRSQQPGYSLSYPYKKIGVFLKPAIKQRLSK